MANFEEGSKQISKGLKKGTDVLTNLFDSFKKIVPGDRRSYSVPTKTSEGAIEIKPSGKKSRKGGFVETIMSKKVIIPVGIGFIVYFGFRKLMKVK